MKWDEMKWNQIEAKVTDSVSVKLDLQSKSESKERMQRLARKRQNFNKESKGKTHWNKLMAHKYICRFALDVYSYAYTIVGR